MKLPRPLVLIAIVAIAVSARSDTTKRRPVSPAPSLERILIPFSAEGEPDPPDQWYSELFVDNEGSDDLVIVYEHPCMIGTPPVGVDPCAARPETLPPHRLTEIRPANAMRGAFLYVSRGKTKQLTRTLHVQDMSSGFPPQPAVGTELPLVAEDQFTNRIHLLNVPSVGGPSVRKILRIYGNSIDPITVHVNLDAVEFSAEKPLETFDITLQPGRTSGGFAVVPASAVVDLTSLIEANQSAIPQARVTVEITSSEEKFWAFVSVINDPRQWTTITSDR